MKSDYLEELYTPGYDNPLPRCKFSTKSISNTKGDST
jgi:hypothetical protein